MIRHEEQSDGDLLRRMGAGDEAAFRAIYRRCQGPIYRFALHMTGNPSIAEDVTQEVFMFLIQEAGRFDPSRGTLTGYLFGIGRNMVSRRLEKERPFVPLPGSETSNGSGNGNGSGHAPDNGSNNGFGHKANGNLSRMISPPADLIRGEAIGRVRQAVLSLPENYREAVVLCDLQELSYEEAAKVLECAVGTVRSRLHRARSILAEKLREFHNPMRKSVAGGPPK
jgi:RNA polymerase sigma-70 factor (ECF subfamily)